MIDFYSNAKKPNTICHYSAIPSPAKKITDKEKNFLNFDLTQPF